MYSFSGRVRYSEVNSEEKMTLPSLMDYLQDCCTFQSEDLGIGVDYLKENHVAWVLSSWEIIIREYPKLAEEITISTWPYYFKGFYGMRNFTVTNKEGKELAFANSVWVYMDTDAMRPTKLPQEIGDAYRPSMEPAIEYNWADRKLKVVTEGEKKEPVIVQRFHIDTNHHMNNGMYVLVAEEYLPEAFIVKSIRAEYKMAAVLGDKLIPCVSATEDEVTVVLANEEGKTYAIVQFVR